MRKVIAGALAALGVFVIFFGAGNTSWAMAALGLALLILAISLVAVNALRGGVRAWVAGSAHVVSASEPPANSTYGRCELQIVIEAPGLPTAAIKVRDPRVPVAKWPDAGTTLPVEVAVDDPRHVRIQWDDVLTHAEAAEQERFDADEDAYARAEFTRQVAEDEEAVAAPVDDRDVIPGVDDAGVRRPGDAAGREHHTVDLTEAMAADGAGRRAGPVQEVPGPDDGRDGRTGPAPADQAAEPRRDAVVITQTPSGPVVEGQIVSERRDEPPTPAGGADAPPTAPQRAVPTQP
ncbi:MAG TPA: glyoxalase/bleomycin resistance/dioxygenase family protein, partial [Pilimelia sp.]|nr:glyoxalase/bleomycin resistance/dioxygenase family protein [Pilimelia sp.]